MPYQIGLYVSGGKETSSINLIDSSLMMNSDDMPPLSFKLCSQLKLASEDALFNIVSCTPIPVRHERERNHLSHPKVRKSPGVPPSPLSNTNSKPDEEESGRGCTIRMFPRLLPLLTQRINRQLSHIAILQKKIFSTYINPMNKIT